MPRISGGHFVILGGASQVGSYIGEQLLAARASKVVLLDNLSLGSAETIEPLLADSRCTFVRGDILRLNDLIDPLSEADGVFAVAGVMASGIRENPRLSEVNIQGLHNALEASHLQHVKKVVFSSSIGVYGAPEDDPTDEDSPLRWQALPPAVALYCASKVMGEALARFYHEQAGLDFVALRYSAVYGERQHRRALVGGHIAETCLRLRRGEPAIIDGDGSQVQDLVYAGDVARANLMAMESPVTGESMNICAGKDVSQLRAVELIKLACGSTLKPEFRSVQNKAVPPPSTNQAFSREKAKRLLGWEPLVPIEEGIARVLRWIDRDRGRLADNSD